MGCIKDDQLNDLAFDLKIKDRTSDIWCGLFIGVQLEEKD